MNKKVFLKKGLFIGLFLIIIIAVVFAIVIYQVEGEKNVPFYIEKILITSMVDGDMASDTQNIWDINISQPNDIYIYISPKNNSNEVLKTVRIDNFKINSKSNKGDLKILKPTGELNYLYQYSKEDYLDSKLEYIGGINDDFKNLQINNKGGIIGFRVKLENLGNYVSNEDEQIVYDGSLLPKIGILQEEIKNNISFDITIQTGKKISYKTTINIDLPVEDLIIKGNCNLEITGLEELVFKRV